jgi:hypothetical protein
MNKEYIKYFQISGIMKIVVCGSVNFPEKIREIEKQLVEKGHNVVIPHGVEKYDLKYSW